MTSRKFFLNGKKQITAKSMAFPRMILFELSLSIKLNNLWYWKPQLWLHCSQDAEMLRLTWITEASLSTNFGWDLLHPSAENPSSGISFMCCSTGSAFSLQSSRQCVIRERLQQAQMNWLVNFEANLTIPQCLQEEPTAVLLPISHNWCVLSLQMMPEIRVALFGANANRKFLD